jgi:hypothetical protein
MRTIIGFCLAILLVAPAEATSTWLSTHADCKTLQTPQARTICDQTVAARETLNSYTPRLTREGGELKREIYLAVRGPSGDQAVVLITVPFRVPSNSNVSVTVYTPGFTVEHIRGQYAYKIEFRVTKGTELYRVYGGKHVWIPNDYEGPRTLETLEWYTETRTYLPFQDHLFATELAKRGKEYLLGLIREAREGLRSVPSFTYSGKSIAEVHHDEMLLALIMSEHSDADKVFKEDVRLTLPKEYYLLGVLIEIALHGPGAFKEVASIANARGMTQFTDIKKYRNGELRWPGTYTHTYQNCRTADGRYVIMSSFIEGTEDPVNVIRAAYCYLDFELSELPRDAKENYRTDRRLGSVPMLVAFNAGGGWSQWIHRKLRGTKQAKKLTHETLPREFFKRGKLDNPQSYYYVRKYWWSLEALKRL